jgi:hypothetical protein
MEDQQGTDHIARYRATWEHLRAAVEAGDPLVYLVPPEDMASSLLEMGETPATDDHGVYTLLAWLRSVAIAADWQRQSQQEAPADEPEQQPDRPAEPQRPPPLSAPFRIESGQLRRH